MAKVVIDKSTSFGNLIATAIQHINDAKSLLDRAEAAAVVAQQSPAGSAMGTAALEGPTFGFGFGVGQGADGASALQSAAAKLGTFVTVTASGELATLDNGNVI